MAMNAYQESLYHALALQLRRRRDANYDGNDVAEKQARETILALETVIADSEYPRKGAPLEAGDGVLVAKGGSK